jgi:FkbM family methyltransferase
LLQIEGVHKPYSAIIVPHFGGEGYPMKIWEGLKWYARLGGTRAVCATTAFRLFGRPRQLKITPPGCKSPVHLRMDTSDFCAYYDILIAKSRQFDTNDGALSPVTIVDVGAHIGIASIFFARRYPSSRIIAVEPEPSNFALLLKNTRPYKNIQPICAAIWREDGEVALGPSTVHPKGAFQIVESGHVWVRAITMTTLMREAHIQSIDILKMDIEGSETEVFRSCDWIDRVQLIAIELHDRVKTGCRSTVEAATGDFRSIDGGEITFYARQHQPRAAFGKAYRKAAGRAS